MKIVITNYSGNVGKSTIAQHLLAPRIKGAEIYSVETINSDGTDNAEVRGKEFADLHEELLTVDNAIVDIGSSNIESVLTVMLKYPGWAADYDYFVIPTTGAKKQQRDTISTIEALSAVGVPAKSIVVLFNMVELDDNVSDVFSGLIEYHKQEKSFTLKPDAVIHTNEIYGKLRGSKQSIGEVLADQNDYKEKIKTAKDSDEKLEFAHRLSIKRLAQGVSAELDAVFKALIK